MMTELPNSAQFKAEMPQIPGVNDSFTRRRKRNPLLPLMIGFLVFGLVILVAIRWFAHHKPSEPVRVEQAPQIEIPPPPQDPTASLPRASESNPGIGPISDFSKPWSSADFFIKDKLTGENDPATIIRLPGSSALQASGYWAYSRKALYGSCLLEYITDMDKLRGEYGYRSANHPLVGNPCTHTLYDPLKTASLPGNVWVRGAIVQGSDIRPPLGVELKVQDKQILAIRTE
ncbi:MAG TPA: hypothetical protein VKH45_06290 [Candidatus Acidoferrum sp.]|nr:hypothetical protein [Candidatus Acidoferrum sp.]